MFNPARHVSPAQARAAVLAASLPPETAAAIDAALGRGLSARQVLAAARQAPGCDALLRGAVESYLWRYLERRPRLRLVGRHS